VRWPSGLRRQLKVAPVPLVLQKYAGPKGRGFKSHSHQYLLLSFLLGVCPSRVGEDCVVGGKFFIGLGLGMGAGRR
jgi:hypothetical protein